MNKELKTSICIGAGAAAYLEPSELKWLGTMPVRGRAAAVDVFTVAEWQPKELDEKPSSPK
jgi:hypothetical protein